jgi:hypothetical protein
MLSLNAALRLMLESGAVRDQKLKRKLRRRIHIAILLILIFHRAGGYAL